MDLSEYHEDFSACEDPYYYVLYLSALGSSWQSFYSVVQRKVAVLAACPNRLVLQQGSVMQGWLQEPQQSLDSAQKLVNVHSLCWEWEQKSMQLVMLLPHAEGMAKDAWLEKVQWGLVTGLL